MQTLDVSRGTVFWLKAADQSEDTSGKGHHWVVLFDPLAVADGSKEVLWVPLSSFKEWLDESATYRFNVGKSNKFIDARQDSCPLLKFAEVTTVAEVEAKNLPRHGSIKEVHLVGICEALVRSRDTPEAAKRFCMARQAGKAV